MNYYLRYILKNWQHPVKIFQRIISFTKDWIRKTLFISWLKTGLLLTHLLKTSSIIFEKKDIFIKLPNELEYLYPLQVGEFFGIEFGKGWENAELALLEKYTNKNDVVFDIGANFGWYALHLARSKFANVYAFEPGNFTYQVLMKNVLKNNLSKKIKIFKLGIGEKTAKLQLTKNDFLGNHLMTRQEKNNKIPNEFVQITSLDKFVTKNKITKIDVIKCDIEGAELFMLKGAYNTIKKFKPIMLLEIQEQWTSRFGYNSEEIFKFLEQFEYNYLRITESGTVAMPLKNRKKELFDGHNFLFLPKRISKVTQ